MRAIPTCWPARLRPVSEFQAAKREKKQGEKNRAEAPARGQATPELQGKIRARNLPQTIDRLRATAKNCTEFSTTTAYARDPNVSRGVALLAKTKRSSAAEINGWSLNSARGIGG